MKYDHMVKSNGIVYLADEEVPEPAVIEEAETEEAEKIQEEAFEENPTDQNEELRSEVSVEEEKPKRTRRTK